MHTSDFPTGLQKVVEARKRGQAQAYGAVSGWTSAPELGPVPRTKAWEVWEPRREGAAKDWEVSLRQENIRKKNNDKKVFKIRLNKQSTGQFPKGKG